MMFLFTVNEKNTTSTSGRWTSDLFSPSLSIAYCATSLLYLLFENVFYISQKEPDGLGSPGILLIRKHKIYICFLISR